MCCQRRTLVRPAVALWLWIGESRLWWEGLVVARSACSGCFSSRIAGANDSRQSKHVWQQLGGGQELKRKTQKENDNYTPIGVTNSSSASGVPVPLGSIIGSQQAGAASQKQVEGERILRSVTRAGWTLAGGSEQPRFDPGADERGRLAREGRRVEGFAVLATEELSCAWEQPCHR